MSDVRELTLLQCEQYSHFPMNDVTNTADELVDLWSYADIVIEEKYHSCTAWHWEVRYIYETPDKSYQHIGIPVPVDNTYLVVIVDVKMRQIMGHYMLALS